MQDTAVLDLIRSTRDILLPHWGSITPQKKHGEADEASVVTELDLAVENYLKEKLALLDPGARFAGEEFGGSREADRFWLCDPIDGTAHFVRGLPFCSVMLALIENGRVNFSAIYDFVGDVMHYARRGAGAYRNTERMQVSDRPFDRSFLALETRIDEPANYETMRALRKRAILFSSITSGFEFSLVATGKLDGRVCVNAYGKDWDFAPGSLLVEEAGGVVTNIGMRSYDFKNLNLIAANPAVHRALTEGPEALFPVA